MFTTVITDCWGENEKGRQIARYNSLGLGPTDLIGVASDFSSDATIEGGANLIDILDATEGKKGVIVVNVAPRGNKNEGFNGNRFCYFYIKDTLVISSTKGYCLSFVKKFNLAKEVKLMELSDVLKYSVNQKLINQDQSDYIVKTQFRSFDFIPRVAKWLVSGEDIPSETLSISDIKDVPNCIWHIDAFGNAKTSITSAHINIDIKTIETDVGKFNFYKRLKDVPHGETAMYIGSSGLGNTRFLEIASQDTPGSAQKTLKLKIGDTIEIKK